MLYIIYIIYNQHLSIGVSSAAFSGFLVACKVLNVIWNYDRTIFFNYVDANKKI